MDWFKIGKETTKRLYVVTLLFNLYAEYIMQNAMLDFDLSWNQDFWER